MKMNIVDHQKLMGTKASIANGSEHLLLDKVQISRMVTSKSKFYWVPYQMNDKEKVNMLSK